MTNKELIMEGQPLTKDIDNKLELQLNTQKNNTNTERTQLNMELRQFKKLLRSCNFKFSRQGKGSHEVWINDKGETFIFPVAKKEVHNGIVWSFKRNYF